MAVVLSVDEARWRHHLDLLANIVGEHLIPVIKGNGYGFGRAELAHRALALGVTGVAVGTVYEIDDVLAVLGAAHRNCRLVVLTPSLDEHLADVIDRAQSAGVTVHCTVSSSTHDEHLRQCGVATQPIVKLRSAMQRFGFNTVPQIDAAAYAIHPPLAGDDDAHVAMIEAWLDRLDPAVPVQVSHLGAATFRRLAGDHPSRSFELRVGTALWHGDREALRLRADVLEVHAVRAGTVAGYRLTTVPADGSIVMVGAGSAHGVAPLDPDQRSPFHFAQHRLTMVEPPHMHTTMLFVPEGQPTPHVGEWVDVQRPLITTQVDRIHWA